MMQRFLKKAFRNIGLTATESSRVLIGRKGRLPGFGFHSTQHESIGETIRFASPSVQATGILWEGATLKLAKAVGDGWPGKQLSSSTPRNSSSSRCSSYVNVYRPHMLFTK